MLAYAQKVGAGFVVAAGALRTRGPESVSIRCLVSPASCIYAWALVSGNNDEEDLA